MTDSRREGDHGVRRVGVVGGGLMGSGIAQVAALAGFPTIVREVTPALADRARGAIEKSLAKAVERAEGGQKGGVSRTQRDEALSRLAVTSVLADLADCDLVIEAVVEDLDVKRALWRDLDQYCGPHTVYASNTSSLKIGDMASAARGPERFVGLHFFNPVPAMPLVEVVRSAATSAETFDRAFAFARALGKEPIAARDTSGFVVNLLLIPYLLDAVRALERGVASMEDIDLGMRLGAGHPMGPFTLLDVVGLDTAQHVAGIMRAEYGEERYTAPPLLDRLVRAGMLGRKSGRGFYDYATSPPRASALPR